MHSQHNQYLANVKSMHCAIRVHFPTDTRSKFLKFELTRDSITLQVQSMKYFLWISFESKEMKLDYRIRLGF